MLSVDQIQFLYKFCEKHYVRYYDLQVELVDHLANAVEEKMQQNPKLHFEQALNEVYKGFGVMGFATYVREKIKAIEKRNARKYWGLFWSYFTIPKILIAIAIFSSLSIPFFLLPSITAKSFMLLFYNIVAIVIDIYFARRSKKIMKPSFEIVSWPFAQYNFLNFGFWYFLTSQAHYRLLEKTDWLVAYSTTTQIIFFGVLTVLVIHNIVSLSVSKKLMMEAKQTYPIAFRN